MMDRVQLIYLDTSFLSNITKAKMGMLRESSNAEKWRSLLACLRQEVQRGTLICPASQFQTQEVLLANDLNICEFTIIQSELSKGYYLKDWEEILIHQAADQVLIYLGRQNEINRDWDILTEQPTPIIPPNSARKSVKEVLQYAEAQQRRGPFKKSFTDEYKWQRIGLIYETFLQPIRQLQGLPTRSTSPDPLGEIEYKGFMGRLRREAQISANEATKVMEFFESDTVETVPFIHIYASIYAHLSLPSKNRKPQSGDWVDIVALASAIPYCSFVTTDSFMADIIRQLKVATTYRTTIFKPTVQNIAALIKRLEAFTQ